MKSWIMLPTRWTRSEKKIQMSSRRAHPNPNRCRWRNDVQRSDVHRSSKFTRTSMIWRFRAASLQYRQTLAMMKIRWKSTTRSQEWVSSRCDHSWSAMLITLINQLKRLSLTAKPIVYRLCSFQKSKRTLAVCKACKCWRIDRVSTFSVLSKSN